MRPPTRNIAAIAFDLDGTLIDSAPDIAAALNHGLMRAGLRAFDLDAVRGWIGDGPDALIDRALATRGIDDTDGSLHSRLRQDFDAATLSAPLALGCVYPGIRELLVELAAAFPLAVVTNKPTGLARAVLDAAGILSQVRFVCGADRPALRKPAPAMLLAAAGRFEIGPARLLMVGDGPADLAAAAAAGCPAALVAWGYAGPSNPGASVWRIAVPGDLRSGLPTLTRAATEVDR